jgi:hypothetical protein
VGAGSKNVGLAAKEKKAEITTVGKHRTHA